MLKPISTLASFKPTVVVPPKAPVVEKAPAPAKHVSTLASDYVIPTPVVAKTPSPKTTAASKRKSSETDDEPSFDLSASQASSRKQSDVELIAAAMHEDKTEDLTKSGKVFSFQADGSKQAFV